MITVKATVASCPSKAQNNNEDNFYFDGIYGTPEMSGKLDTHSYNEFKSGAQILAVFDGFGAEKTGGTASFIVAELLKKFHKKFVEKTSVDKSQFFNKYITDAHILIKDKMKEKFGTRMGSTLSLLCIDRDKAYMYGVGDSRIYLYREGTLKQLSEDHTQAQRMVNLGILKPEKARTHVQKEKLTQYLGILPEKITLTPWHQEINILPEDIFILCTDGIYDPIDEMRLAQLISVAAEPKELVEYIIGEAQSKGLKDDSTVIAIKAYNEKPKNIISNTKADIINPVNPVSTGAKTNTKARKPANRTIWQTLTAFLISLTILITLSGFGFVKYLNYKNSLIGIGNKGIFGQNNNSDNNNNNTGEFDNNELDDISNYPTSKPDDGNNEPVKTKAPVVTQGSTLAPTESQMVTGTPNSTNTTGTPGKTSTKTPDTSSTSASTPKPTEATATPVKTQEPLPG